MLRFGHGYLQVHTEHTLFYIERKINASHIKIITYSPQIRVSHSQIYILLDIYSTDIWHVQ